MSKSIIERLLEQLVDERLSKLVEEPIATLLLLPKFAPEDLHVENSDVRVVTHHEVQENGEHHVVVQAVRERWSGFMAKIVVKGFAFSPNGNIRKLAPEELYDFT